MNSTVDPRENLFSRLESACQEGETPGCVGLVWREGSLLYHEAHGVLATHKKSLVEGVSVERDTRYDLASLTKVLCTTTLIAKSLASGAVHLDQRLPRELLIQQSEFEQPRLHQILEHCGGYVAHRNFFTRATTRDMLLNEVCATAPFAAPGQQALYSDLGFIVLGAWLEQLYQQPLDVLFEREVSAPLGLDKKSALAFRRRSALEMGTLGEISARERVELAPTEVYDPTLHPESPPWFAIRRESIAHGVVHDDNAYCMGGVAGHAGLFGHAEAVLTLAKEWLRPGPLGLSRTLCARFFRASTVQGSSRCLGWDSPAVDGSGSTGLSLQKGAIGHLGFTGTSVWIAPGIRSGRGDCIYVLLSNRVHPSRDHAKIRGLRRDFHELAIKL